MNDDDTSTTTSFEGRGGGGSDPPIPPNSPQTWGVWIKHWAWFERTTDRKWPIGNLWGSTVGYSSDNLASRVASRKTLVAKLLQIFRMSSKVEINIYRSTKFYSELGSKVEKCPYHPSKSGQFECLSSLPPPRFPSLLRDSVKYRQLWYEKDWRQRKAIVFYFTSRVLDAHYYAQLHWSYHASPFVASTTLLWNENTSTLRKSPHYHSVGGVMTHVSCQRKVKARTTVIDRVAGSA